MTNLNVELREGKRGLSTLRAGGFIPAVVYGHGVENKSLKVAKNEFLKVFESAGENTLIDLVFPDKDTKKVLIQDVQFNPVSGDPMHIDFRQIKMDEELTANIPLVFVGESKAVKTFGGILIKNTHEVEVKCLPANLPHEIEVDLTLLETLDSAIHASDLKVSDKVAIVNLKADDAIVVVAKPVEEKVEESTAAADVPEAGKEGDKKEGEAKEGEKKEESK